MEYNKRYKKLFIDQGNNLRTFMNAEVLEGTVIIGGYYFIVIKYDEAIAYLAVKDINMIEIEE